MTTPVAAPLAAHMRHDVSTVLLRWEVRVPKWVDVAERIREKILSGEYAVGEKIPSYRDLAAEHGFSEVTARRAVAELAAEGLVRPRHGFGVVVTATPEEARSTVRTFSERLDDHERRLRALEEGR